MKISAKRRIQLQKLGIIFMFWVGLGFIFGLAEHLTLLSDVSLGTVKGYSVLTPILIQMSAAAMGGLLGGAFLVFYVNEKLREKPYGYTILSVSGAFILITGSITICMATILAPYQSKWPLFHPATQKAFFNILTDPIHIKNVIMWFMVTIVTQLVLQINDKFGQGLLWDFIRGKYHSPVTETRIFMFVDIKSSTSIAERLGNERYYCLLRDFFADITDPILYQKGEVYQYVGDEVVISWKMNNGLENDNCLNCYFKMREKIKEKAEIYKERYGLVPEFKAGMHYGEVTAGEIGILKRDLTFSGDVLNTAARIQGECNNREVLLLTSNTLLERLNLTGFQSVSLGAITLRGKEEKMELSTVSLV